MTIEHIYEIIKTTTLRGKHIYITTSFFITTLQNINGLKFLYQYKDMSVKSIVKI